jgi:AcrR family transcriptional regulator
VRVLPIAKASTSRRVAPKSVKYRLAEAFSSITSMESGSASRPTISALCRAADVSRNTLYRYYPDIAKAVRHFGGRNGKRARLARQKALAALRSEVSLLRGQLAQMATLADHYHAAAEEQRALVARRDRELAALRNNAPQRRRASIAERAPATQRNTRALTIVPSGRS